MGEGRGSYLDRGSWAEAAVVVELFWGEGERVVAVVVVVVGGVAEERGDGAISYLHRRPCC